MLRNLSLQIHLYQNWLVVSLAIPEICLLIKQPSQMSGKIEDV